jgi:2,4-dienoyl-CoA reductase-like NADH-dependent reductase (Old Yellow Enzyme family)
MAGTPGIFDEFVIKDVTLRSRVLRSSLGGRLAYYDGTPTPAWRNFERRFALAENRLGAIISATIGVDDRRLSPLEYPKIGDRYSIEPLASGVRAVQAEGCRYIVQLGDPGGHTHTSLFPEDADGKSASAWIDGYYGYRSVTTPMTLAEIAAEVEAFRAAATLVKDAGADGVEVTASKGYIIHQFLNPATNRRRDAYGGSVENRFRLLKEVVTAVRAAVGSDYLFGVRLAAADFNWLPFPNLRWPPVWPPRDYFCGNTLRTTLRYGEWLTDLGVDYLHIDSGFGFVNPKGSPGPYPFEGLRLFSNSARHLSTKAWWRAVLLNAMPKRLAQTLLGTGWRFVPAANAEFARAFKRRLNIPIIANGGFQERGVIEGALQSGACDLVAIGRPLLANPDLLQYLAAYTVPPKPCTWCSQCCTRTAVLPLGCYDASRFDNNVEAMQKQILLWSSDSAA